MPTLHRPRLSLFALVMVGLSACAPEVTITEQRHTPDEAGLSLTQSLEGTWFVQSVQYGSCPAHALSHPMSGYAQWQMDEDGLSLRGHNPHDRVITVYAVDDTTLSTEVVVEGMGCRLNEGLWMQIDSLSDDRASGSLIMDLSWTDRAECHDLVAQYTEGTITAPCDLIVDWIAFRL